MTEDHLLVPEIAVRLHMPSWKVIRWLEAGRIVGERVHGRWWATVAAVERVKQELDSEPAT